MNNEKWVIWCGLNSEQDALEEMFKGRCVSIHGKHSMEEKEEMEKRWREGDVPILISKIQVFGFGMNWQHCHNMIFVGLSHSYEAMFQAIRRCYRFGQLYPVNVHIITSDAEGAVLENVKRKEKDFDIMCAAMLDNMRETQRENVLGAQKTLDTYAPMLTMAVPSWL